MAWEVIARASRATSIRSSKAVSMTGASLSECKADNKLMTARNPSSSLNTSFVAGSSTIIRCISASNCATNLSVPKQRTLRARTFIFSCMSWVPLTLSTYCLISSICASRPKSSGTSSCLTPKDSIDAAVDGNAGGAGGLRFCSNLALSGVKRLLNMRAVAGRRRQQLTQF